MTDRRLVQGADLEVEVHGVGEPVLFVQTALTSDELLPIAQQPVLADRYQTILYHRRGYASSSSSSAPGSIVRDAKDAAALLEALGIEHAHVVGFSFSGAIALQLASAIPDRVHSLTLIEPPPVHVPSAAEFRAANARLQESRRSGLPKPVCRSGSELGIAVLLGACKQLRIVPDHDRRDSRQRYSTSGRPVRPNRVSRSSRPESARCSR
jgi:pimeloyl-ACP methyl ester carboxylesterase